MTVVDFETIRSSVSPDQIVRYFGYEINSSGKIRCPFHAEELPSMQLYPANAFCFGCKTHHDTASLARALLSKEQGREVSYSETLRWFSSVELPAKSEHVGQGAEYLGPVPREFLDYWVSCMDDSKYEQVTKERLISRSTAEKYKLGWRPDWKAWTIPFWRGEPGTSEADIVQFRLTESKVKYLGLRGHSRGSVQNAHLLQEHQPYVTILFGAFDAIAALDHGIIAVGINGSMPFRKADKERLQRLFSRQTNLYVVPDNTESEFKCAYVFQDWLNAQVRFFPADSPAGTDYIDYRKSGYSAFDFKQSVLCLNMPQEIVSNVADLLEVGDPYNLARYHASYACTLSKCPSLVAHDLILNKPEGFTVEQWQKLTAPLAQVHTEDDLFHGVEKASQMAYTLRGGW